MMMKMMKMMVVLVLSGLLCVSADVLRIDGCSETDGEVMYGMDGEEAWYADFKNKKGVKVLPSFGGAVRVPEGLYEESVANLQTCKMNLKLARGAFKDLTLEQDPPSSLMIYTKEAVELREKNTLICYVTGFYPAPVIFSWTKNGENVTEGSSTNLPYPNKDVSFNQFSRLDFIPQLDDIYSCTVNHLALDQPLTRIWDMEKTHPGVGPTIFCGLGLTVCLLGVAAGIFFLIKGNECS
ncbi:RLA class II histocompatibility antigen, DP alpha-1 chain-like [Perca fluviatilis]|uniref:RLA class II histocompatibility antigen, DP alpha-1 chain-like n=1 Tax=Perca fluviatilis TaxID=8168 RepID=UPI001964C1C6|nr:RLA class II histocompatibility antigen, DP alpha-1 chain-like [Perca fluviatilis]